MNIVCGNFLKKRTWPKCAKSYSRSTEVIALSIISVFLDLQIFVLKSKTPPNPRRMVVFMVVVNLWNLRWQLFSQIPIFSDLTGQHLYYRSNTDSRKTANHWFDRFATNEARNKYHNAGKKDKNTLEEFLPSSIVFFLKLSSPILRAGF
jgi:hypothetical protein